MDNSKENLDKLNNERENTKKNNVFAYITKQVCATHGKISVANILDYADLLEWEMENIFDFGDVEESKKHQDIIDSCKDLVEFIKTKNIHSDILIDSIYYQKFQ